MNREDVEEWVACENDVSFADVCTEQESSVDKAYSENSQEVDDEVDNEDEEKVSWDNAENAIETLLNLM